MTKETAKQIILDSLNKLKKFADVPVEETAPTEESTKNTMKLENGDEIIVEGEFMVGSPVMKADNTPLDNGDYILEDGRTFSVENGMVSVVGEPVTEEQPEEEIQMSAEYVSRIEKLESENGELKSHFQELLEIVTKLTESNNDKFSKLENKVEEFSATPASEPINTIKNIESKPLSIDEIRLEKLMALKNASNS